MLNLCCPKYHEIAWFLCFSTFTEVVSYVLLYQNVWVFYEIYSIIPFNFVNISSPGNYLKGEETEIFCDKNKIIKLLVHKTSKSNLVLKNVKRKFDCFLEDVSSQKWPNIPQNIRQEKYILKICESFRMINVVWFPLNVSSSEKVKVRERNVKAKVTYSVINNDDNA